MRRYMTAALAAAVALLAPAAVSPAAAASYTIGWSGSFGYTMTGFFSFPDALLGSSAINQTNLTALSIQLLENGVSQGTWNYFTDGLAPSMTLNFNFDPSTGKFLIGEMSDAPNGQAWNYQSEGDNCPASGIGFVTGNAGEAACLNGNLVSGVEYEEASSTLTATRETTLTRAPEPGTIGLYLVGLAGLAAVRRRAAAAVGAPLRSVSTRYGRTAGVSSVIPRARAIR